MFEIYSAKTKLRSLDISGQRSFLMLSLPGGNWQAQLSNGAAHVLHACNLAYRGSKSLAALRMNQRVDIGFCIGTTVTKI